MEAAGTRRTQDRLGLFLAGLEAGMIAALALGLWMALSALLQGRGLWGFASMTGSVFYGASAFRRGLHFPAVAGLALQLVVYSLLGAVFALLLRDRMSRFRMILTGIVFALGWYYLSFGLLWPHLAPFVARLHVPPATIVGHILFGAMLGRFRKYWKAAPEPAPAAEPASPGPAAQAHDGAALTER